MRFRLKATMTQNVAAVLEQYSNPALSYRAKGLLAYWQTLPANQSVDVQSLQAISTEGKQAIKTAIWELERAGLCEPAPEAAATDKSKPNPPDSELPLFDSPQPPDAARHATAVSQNASLPVGRVIDRLNELRQQAWDWKNYTPLSSRYAKNTEHISGRLKEGYREADLIQVLEYLAAVDGGKEESRRYFDCVTPFNTKNFERNLALARDWHARGRPASVSRLQRNLEQSHDPSIYDRGRRGGGQ